MGRKKISIKPILDERLRMATFNKRKNGLLKKAYELSVLCDAEIGLIIFNPHHRLIEYGSSDMDRILLRYTEHGTPSENRNNKDFEEFMKRKAGEAGGADSDDDEGEGFEDATPPGAEAGPSSWTVSAPSSQTPSSVPVEARTFEGDMGSFMAPQPVLKQTLLRRRLKKYGQSEHETPIMTARPQSIPNHHQLPSPVVIPPSPVTGSRNQMIRTLPSPGTFFPDFFNNTSSMGTNDPTLSMSPTNNALFWPTPSKTSPVYSVDDDDDANSFSKTVVKSLAKNEPKKRTAVELSRLDHGLARQ